MSRLLVPPLVLGFAVGCSSATDEGGGDTFTVSGTLEDSLSAEAVPAAAVSLGPRSTETDPAGAFTFSGVPSGTLGFTATADGYRAYMRDVQVAGNTVVDARLLRLRPYLESFGQVSGGYVAVWIDLDGAVDLRGGLRPITVSATDGTSRVLYNTGATELDELRREYRYSESAGSSPAARVVLTHEDGDGHRVRFECTPSWTCEETSDGSGQTPSGASGGATPGPWFIRRTPRKKDRAPS